MVGLRLCPPCGGRPGESTLLHASLEAASEENKDTVLNAPSSPSPWTSARRSGSTTLYGGGWDLVTMTWNITPMFALQPL